ncbi:MAG: hypothetical protein ABIQ82_14140 [Variovorax sp.]
MIEALSPRAAKIALRMLDRDPDVPADWVLALRPALVARCRRSSGFALSDWLAVASIERPRIHEFTWPFENEDHRRARYWMLSLRDQIRVVSQG